jgi:SAM-dependent methyltransferase
MPAGSYTVARMRADPQAANPNQVGYSLANVAELLFPCLEAAGARSVLEIGAYKGELTAELLAWAESTGAEIAAVDPQPEPALLELARQNPELELLRQTSHEVLAERALPDAIVLDGDHNYFTLSEELRLIAARSPSGGIPLLMFHDVYWPHARRDSYYAPERIPEDRRQALAKDAGLVPGEPGVVAGGLRFEWAAASEGGPRNGVLTAIEDFLAADSGLRLARVPAFFGFGVLWREDAPYAARITEIVGPFDRQPVLERLEANRVAHLVTAFERGRELHRLSARVARQEELLRSMAASRAFALAERLSRLRRRGGEPAFSRERVERSLREDGD